MTWRQAKKSSDARRAGAGRGRTLALPLLRHAPSSIASHTIPPSSPPTSSTTICTARARSSRRTRSSSSSRSPARWYHQLVVVDHGATNARYCNAGLGSRNPRCGWRSRAAQGDETTDERGLAARGSRPKAHFARASGGGGAADAAALGLVAMSNASLTSAFLVSTLQPPPFVERCSPHWSPWK